MAPLLPDSPEELLRFYQDTRRDGDIRLRALKKLLTIDPSIAKQIGGDIVRLAEREAAKSFVGRNKELSSDQNEMLTEIWHGSMRDEKNKLLQGDLDPVAVMLVDRVVMIWLRIQYLEWNLAQEMGRAEGQKKVLYLNRLLVSTQNSHLYALQQFNMYREQRERIRAGEERKKAKTERIERRGRGRPKRVTVASFESEIPDESSSSGTDAPA